MERIITLSAVAEWIKRAWSEQWGSQCSGSHAHVGYQITLRIPPPLFLSLLSALSHRQEGQDGGMWWRRRRGGSVEASVGSWSKPEGSVRGEVINHAKQSDWLCYTMQGTVTGLRCLFRSGNLQGSSVVAWPCIQTQLQKHSFVSQLWIFKIWELYQSGFFFFARLINPIRQISFWYQNIYNNTYKVCKFSGMTNHWVDFNDPGCRSLL